MNQELIRIVDGIARDKNIEREQIYTDIEQAIAARRQSRPKATSAACPRCGAPMQPDDDFCPRCGAALRLTCPKCGTAAQTGDQFCAKCGTQLPSTPAEVSA